MPNLFPNMEEQQYHGSDDFILAAPFSRQMYELIERKAKRSKQFKPAYYRCDDIWGDRKITILLRKPDHTMDDLIFAAGYLRMTENNNDRMYCVGVTDLLGDRISQFAGARGDLCAMFELPKD